ncbi:sensor histidine kinase [Nocardioides yefusunii]|uniref:histidine kinase n=1 Tax=Nocardioides yefusunii TaxID=2500546 RepID=A0ABW1QYR5_9ACTN|nr:HAMP domain-containing sensor histidine kinase [Nocardioides yefusunii]
MAVIDRATSTRVFLDALRNLALGVSETTEFATVAISVAFHDRLETLAVAGDRPTRQLLLGRTLPCERAEKLLHTCDRWGDLYLVPFRSLVILSDQTSEPSPDATDPDTVEDHDVLVAAIRDGFQNLRGLVAVDRPRDGQRPDANALAHLENYVEQVRRTLIYALERLELDEHMRMADAVRKVVREASSRLSVEHIIGYCQAALTETFDASGIWLQTFDGGVDAAGAIYSTNGFEVHLGEELRQVARPAARLLWEAQSVAEISERVPRSEAMTPQQEQLVLDFMRAIDLTSMLFVPLGAGPECLGNLVLTRLDEPRPWTESEKRTALDIGHDLGRALLNARTFERERQVVAELRELDSYKSRLIATLAHELKNPLTSILGHAELLEGSDLPPSARSSVASVERGAARMQRLVDDLLALGKANDPQLLFEPEPYDLRAGVEETLDLLRVTVERKGLSMHVVAPDSVVVQGEPAGLEQVLTNLISNATKYTPDGGHVEVRISDEPDAVVLTVEDTGMGISREDLPHLFTEFFRSTNPAAVKLPGTGLGLAIAHRIVARHGGTLHCTSTYGHGTTFTATFPKAALT